MVTVPTKNNSVYYNTIQIIINFKNVQLQFIFQVINNHCMLKGKIFK